MPSQTHSPLISSYTGITCSSGNDAKIINDYSLQFAHTVDINNANGAAETRSRNVQVYLATRIYYLHTLGTTQFSSGQMFWFYCYGSNLY